MSEQHTAASNKKIALQFLSDADRLRAKETFEAEQCGAKGRTV